MSQKKLLEELERLEKRDMLQKLDDLGAEVEYLKAEKAELILEIQQLKDMLKGHEDDDDDGV